MTEAVLASTVFVRRVPPGATRADIVAAFEVFGTIKGGARGITILPQKTHNDASLNVVVDFQDTRSAAEAVQYGSAGQVRMNGRTVTVVENRGDRQSSYKNGTGQLSRGNTRVGGKLPPLPTNTAALTMTGYRPQPHGAPLSNIKRPPHSHSTSQGDYDHNRTAPLDKNKPTCALCGVNLTSEHHDHRTTHERGNRHKDNLRAVLHAMQRDRCVSAALAGMVGQRVSNMCDKLLHYPLACAAIVAR
jgi:hypothetical protein